MSSCNCYRCRNTCAPTNCTTECVCSNPDYSSLGCIDNYTECILYNGTTINSTIDIVKNENLNTILTHVSNQFDINQDAIEDLQANDDIKTAKATFSSADILQLFTTPVVLVGAPGDDKMIVPIRSIIKFTYGTTTYTTNTTLVLSVGDLYVTTISGGLAYIADKFINVNLIANAVSSTTTAINAPLMIKVATADPLAGDSVFTIFTTYTIIDLA